MVCQAASQTRFRALKHESGIAGNSTIIVRVIACFQPLRECQVCDIHLCVMMANILVLFCTCHDLPRNMLMTVNLCVWLLFRLNISVICSNLSRNLPCSVWVG